MSASKPERAQEPVVVGSLVGLLLVLWLGFFFHRSPQFAGSAGGGVLAVLAALGVIGAALYSPLKRASAGPGLLRWHVFLGVAAALLAVLHTAHRFDSTLGIALSAMVLAVVLSGFAGRHLLMLAGTDERDLRNRLEMARLEYARIAEQAARGEALRFAAGGEALALAEAMADLEYGLAAQQGLRRALSRWRVVHLAASFALLTLLALHVWAVLEFGLRWFR
jgi:hypothetical protein